MEPVYLIPAAVGLGALHALEPGHGKGVITAYLVATRGKTIDALLIGAISAVTHTCSIIMLAYIASSALHRLAPENTASWIGLTAGLLILLIGAKMMYTRYYPRIISVGKLSRFRENEVCDHHEHGHPHHVHRHMDDGPPNSLLRLAAVGVITGLIPCPSAVAIFLAAITADQIPLGVGLVGAFSLGSAISMCAVGMLVVRIGQAINRQRFPRIIRSLQNVSAFIVIGIGLYVVLQSIGDFRSG